MGTFRPASALTFDDVLLVPRLSSVHPRNVDVRSRFTRGIPLNIPLVSAAMDTVTESEMAIAIAREGGIGVLHKNMPVDRQAAEVDRVKRSESGMILHPITLGPDRPLREAMRLMERFRISGVPIVDDAGRLVGIITNRDLQFERELDRPIRDAMTKDRLVTAPVGTGLDEAERILAKHRIEKLPVVDDKGVLKGLITIKDIFKRRRHPHANKDQHGRLRVAAAVGGTSDALARARALLDAGCDVIVVDSAHGHSEGVLKTVACLREAYPDAQLVGGNVATEAGGGAPGRRFKEIRGMVSPGDMEEGSADRYFQEGEVSPPKLVPEGIEGRVPYRGPASDVIFQMVGGLRSGMGYCGVCDVKALRAETEFIQITSAGLRESHPHDVVITREAPNYSL